MRRAWAIFRQTYKYPLIKFKDIGRSCFSWALRQAWGEARDAARVAAIPVRERAERIQTLQTSIERASYIDHGPTWRTTIAAYRAEIRQLRTAGVG
jgi:CRISPR/Cas system Type II protein with McrA/HNH and RuvC-like nuclease domain